MEELTQCPVCAVVNTLEKKVSTVRDHSLSGESFSISRCTECSVLLTDPRPKEVEIGAYYDFPKYVSHRDDAPGLINWLYQQARRYTTSQKLRLIEKVRKKSGADSTLLDYGCGTGFFLQAAIERGWQAVGIEVSETARQTAADRVKKRVFEQLNELADGATFGVITLWHVLEHIHELNATLGEIIARLAPSGTLIIAVPNPASSDAGQYQEWWAAFDVPRHLYHFPPQAIHRLMQRHGMEVVEQIGQPLDALYIGLLSEKYRRGSALKGIINGVRSDVSAWKTGNYSSIIYVIKRKAK